MLVLVAVIAFAAGAVAGVAYKPKGDMLACRDAVSLGEQRMQIAVKMSGNKDIDDLNRLAAEGERIWPKYSRSVDLCRAGV